MCAIRQCVSVPRAFAFVRAIRWQTGSALSAMFKLVVT
jgi:hypothetical protein